MIYSTVDAKGSKSIVDKTTEHEELRVTVMFSVVVDRMIMTLFVTLKRKNITKEKLCHYVVSKYDEKGWMIEELS
jgi:hypothetical protein